MVTVKSPSFDSSFLAASRSATCSFVTVVGTALSVAVITLAAYPISQDRVRYRRILNFFVLFTMLFNGGIR